MTSKYFWNPGNWSRLDKNSEVNDFVHRRNIVFSQIMVLILIGLFVHLISDAARSDFAIVGIVAVTIVLTFLFYVLNERGKHRLATLLFFSYYNVMLFLLASLVPREISLGFLFGPLVGLALILNARQDIPLTIFFVGISLSALITLEVLDYNLFGSFKLLYEPSLFNSIINIVSSCLILAFSLWFVIRANLRAELQLMRREEQLRQANEKLDRFLFSASHDLRAPLNSVRGLVSLAAMETDQNILNKYFMMIDDRTTKLDSFILDILEFSRSAKEEIKIEQVSIKEIVEEIADSIQFMDGAHKVKFITDFGNVDFIETDRQKLSIVLRNLLSNSVKYHNQSNLDQWVRISAEHADDNILLTVSDNGIGIEDHLQEKVFDMFYRASDRSSGSGLGLYIVKEALGQLNGGITLQSEYGKGSSFKVSLPKVRVVD
ncbi:MAG: HAMP domain-containing histidine kinase [Bacteroidetes bacterium]|nr:HAMP domain-containing histidine kinase [Bacteroidota bacterium]